MKKRIAAVFMAVTMVASMTGCTGKPAGGVETTASTEAASGAEGTVKVGLILGTGGLGDKNFNDMAYAGVLKAQEDLGIEFDYVEPNAISDFVPLGVQFAETEEYDLLLTIGSDQEESTKEIAGDFPNQKISLIDSGAQIEGVSTLQTKWSEQTFLSGVIAGLGTQSSMGKANSDNVIGVILGMDLPNLREGVIGFAAGAKYVNPEVEVLEGVVGAFNDPGKGKEIALSMYNKGADYIQCIAGASGLGVFGAAKEADRYAFGVGSNQNAENPDYIVASSVRSVEQIVYNEIEKVVKGTWEPGLHSSGIKEGAVGYDTSGSNAVIPEDILTAVEDIKAKLISGELVPCRSAEELDKWVSENQYKK